MADATGGINRRRVLQGAAWATPAILFATAAPARAVSESPILPAGTGLIFNGFYTYAQDSFWDATSGSHRTVVVANANVQNYPGPGGGTVPTVVTFRLTFKVPVGTATAPFKWGLGSNAQGIYDPSMWTAVGGGPTVDGSGIATCVFDYLAPPLATYGNKQPTMWIETQPRQDSATVSATTVATHENGATSIDGRSGVTTTLSPGAPIVIVDDHNTYDTYDDWVFYPEPTIYTP